MDKPFNENLYNACIKGCKEKGIPEELAKELARIVATDDPSLPNLGRSQQDTQTCFEALKYL